jgi:hypothetical protein
MRVDSDRERQRREGHIVCHHISLGVTYLKMIIEYRWGWKLYLNTSYHIDGRSGITT